MLKKIYQELVAIRKELQNIRGILESNQEYVDIQKACHLHTVNESHKKPNTLFFQEALRASRQYLQE